VIEPLRFSLEVDCPQALAFALWTERASVWWPPSHKLSGDAEAAVVFEPRVGGRVFERAGDGRVVEWGEVTEWDPPSTLSYRWHIGTTPAEATLVRIAFTAIPAGRTRVDIVHSGWEGLGAKGPGWRERNTSGWSGVLPAYARACGPSH
jgi:hypothetical protein